ncbi:copper-transporting ATPase PAA1, chloroplastic isoform X3 [Populus alba]|uniref:copper-transporting ATPase PAA1, chloroplastic isoform X3 n=1 Tax=Populus alba TaxID=43335 RepID=UPI003CC74A94
MESAVAISATTVPLFILSKALNRHSTTNTTRSLLRISSTQLVTRRLSSIYSRNNDLLPSSHSLKGLRAGVPLVRLRLECVSSSAASFGTTSGGGGGEFGGGGGGEFGGGGGGGGSNGGDAESNSVAEAVGAEEAPELSPDVIILDVGGMTCGGCAASVKRILESQSQVFSASVNLATETAIVRPVTEAKVVPNWQKQLGEALAKHLTSCGFISNLRDEGRDNVFKVFEKKMDEKRDRLKESGHQLAVSWTLCAGWKAFFEEPIMLIAFVLLGRNLEQRAKIKAASDMTGLLSVLPTKARLVVNGDATDLGSIVEVPCSSLSIGDQIVVLPGDRVPADGTVRAGRSTIDESSFTGEPLPVTKLPGSQVSAGSINLNGSLTIEVKRPGGETAMGDIVRLVEEAQSREAPVQRLADKVSGHFTYGVMAISAATFMFWSMFGTRILPAALNQGNPVSLALQLSCSVLVVACPCALGLATPTAVLVGTSLGATRGLLLRGGNVLEKFSMVNSVVFDKTGTLTIGRPVVTKVVSLGGMEITDSQLKPNAMWSEVEVLKLAAGVESNTIHPVGKAIVEAAQAASCTSVKQVTDGTFMEEPGSGAVATIENKVVSVGTLDWIQRHGVCENPFQEVEDINNQSVVYVGVDNKLAGLIYFEDQIREDARQVVESLSCQGINVYMLSGDRKKNAEHVASLVGIPKEKVLSGVKPDEKKKFISELQKDQNIVAMVGDGINDAAALAESHVGVAMGEGVGAASEVSSIVLMGNRLSQVLDALELSRLTMKTVKQNLWWAFAYNIVGIPIAAGMLLPITGTILTPSIAGALMGFSSIGVMMNSLLLRLKFSSKQKKVRGAFPDPKIYLDSVLLDQKEKIKPPWSDSRWR